MSQIFKTLTSGGPIPPNIPTQFTTDVGGPVIPVGNNVNVNGQTHFVDYNAGIRTEGIGDTMLLQLTNRLTGAIPTTDATLTTIIGLSTIGLTGTIFVYGNVQAFNASTPAGASYGFSGAFRIAAGNATEIASEYHDEFEEAALAGADIFLSASGTNILLQVQGVALNLTWNSLLEYRMVS